ncbi:hypothetical protein B0T10DRAFT_611739, partial [Thelonectria olida]
MRSLIGLVALAFSGTFDLAAASRCKPSSSIATTGTPTGTPVSTETPVSRIVKNLVSNGNFAERDPNDPTKAPNYKVDGEGKIVEGQGHTGDGSTERGCIELQARQSGSATKRKRAVGPSARISQDLFHLDVRTPYTVRFFYAVVTAPSSLNICQLNAYLGTNGFFSTWIFSIGSSVTWSTVLLQTNAPQAAASLSVSITCFNSGNAAVYVDSIFMSNQVTPANINEFAIDYGTPATSATSTTSIGGSTAGLSSTSSAGASSTTSSSISSTTTSSTTSSSIASTATSSTTPFSISSTTTSSTTSFSASDTETSTAESTSLSTPSYTSLSDFETWPQESTPVPTTTSETWLPNNSPVSSTPSTGAGSAVQTTTASTGTEDANDGTTSTPSSSSTSSQSTTGSSGDTTQTPQSPTATASSASSTTSDSSVCPAGIDAPGGCTAKRGVPTQTVSLPGIGDVPDGVEPQADRTCWAYGVKKNGWWDTDETGGPQNTIEDCALL